MTIKELIAILKEQGWKWQKIPLGVEGSTPTLLRSCQTLPQGGEESFLCPITAACFQETGKFFSPLEVVCAGALLKLSLENTHLIVGAADELYLNWSDPKEVERTKKIRCNLEAALIQSRKKLRRKDE